MQCLRFYFFGKGIPNAEDVTVASGEANCVVTAIKISTEIGIACMASNLDKIDDHIDQAIHNAYGAKDTTEQAIFERLYTIGFNPIVKE